MKTKKEPSASKSENGTPSRQSQTFSISAPAAMSVQLVGDFTHWQQKPIPLHKSTDGTWLTKVDLHPGSYHYRFLVDGQWRDDPECALHIQNPYGSKNAVRQVA